MESDNGGRKFTLATSGEFSHPPLMLVIYVFPSGFLQFALRLRKASWSYTHSPISRVAGGRLRKRTLLNSSAVGSGSLTETMWIMGAIVVVIVVLVRCQRRSGVEC